MRKKNGFTLVELLVVISIIAMLLAILIPSLNKARGSAQRVVCLNQLKTIGMNNILYANDFNGRYVPACDMTVVKDGERSWNVNVAFLKYMGLANSQGKAAVDGYQMQDKYMCPTDLQLRNPNVWKITNKVSYGYNMSDWTWRETKEQFLLASNIPYAPPHWRGLVVNKIKKPSEKVFFCDSQDIWVLENQANYKTLWDKAGSDTKRYKDKNFWQVVYYRHFEGANVLFCDGRAVKMKKEDMFFYDSTGSPDTPRNDKLWFTDPSNRTSPATVSRL
ncbi:MAG: hypothetical protein A2Y10_05450 [Planctomycetes bacterium GWF2_41_51]|nr:MAG: hypothetical protein A2Y10_05450 [Planctomycetes bacterium GWF2_41_51]HBG26796.1 hypothetical protein [Phycisphaerales bacterium]